MSSYSYPRPRACGHACACDPCQIRKLECELQKLKQRVGECCDNRPTPEETVCDVFADATAGVPESTDTALYKKTDNTFVKATTTQTFCGIVNAAGLQILPDPNTNDLVMKDQNTNNVTTATPCRIFNGLVGASSELSNPSATDPSSTDPSIAIAGGLTVTNDPICYKASPCFLFRQTTVQATQAANVGMNPSKFRFLVVDDDNVSVCYYMTLQQIIDAATP